MSKEPFEKVWEKILTYEEEKFYTKTHLEFTYRIKGKTFHSSRTKQNIGKSDIEKAYSMMPIDKPGVMRDIVRGYAYVWAVLHDKRISQGKW